MATTQKYNKKIEIVYSDEETTLKSLVKKLKKNGVATLSDILDEKECENITIDAFKWLNEKPLNKEDKFDINDKKTWRNISKKFNALHGGMIQHHNIGQSQFAWNVRSHPNVKKVFEKLFKTNDLYVSFDGVNITPPPEVTNLGKRTSRLWFHTDQGYKKKGMISIQSFVTMMNVDEGDSTLLVLKGSNVFHEEFFETFKTFRPNGDWCKLTEEHLDWFITKKGCKPTAIKASKGSIILWESRTIHMGLSAASERQNKDRFRLIIYVAMFPKTNLTESDKEKRKKWFEEGRMTSHWGTKLFSKIPRTYGTAIIQMNEYVPPILNEIGKLLI